MNIWIRAFPFIDQGVRPKGACAQIFARLGIEIYPNEEDARAAAASSGGIAKLVDAESLRGQLSEHGFLAPEPESARTGEVEDLESSSIIAGVVYSSLPHTTEIETFNDDEENECTESYAVFEPEASAWLEEVKNATGITLSQ